MTTTRTAGPVFTPPLRSYIKETSADAAPLRAMLEAAGISTEGRSLAAAVRAFQTRHNASGGEQLEVDGKAGEHTLRALQGKVDAQPRDAVGHFPSQAIAYDGARSSEAVSGVKLNTAMHASGGGEAAARRVLEAQLPRARAEETPVEGGHGAVAAAGRKIIPSSTPVPFSPPVGRDGFAAAIEEATRSGRSQLLEMNGARVIVRPGDTMDAVKARYATAKRFGGVPVPKVDMPVARALGKAVVPLGLALDALDIGAAVKRDAQRADGANTEATRAVGRAAGGWGGAAAGAAAGAAVGSVVPLVGTAIGAVVGGVAGGLGGSKIGEVIAEAI